MVENENDDIKFFGKVATFPKNTKAKKAFNFLENVKISKRKLWYFIIEKDIITENVTNSCIQMIKYNNKKGVDCSKFIKELKNYYAKDEKLLEYINNLIIDGNDKFSVIRNIPDVEINGEKLISKITKDLIKLLYK
jgi:hypothetical protein